jgi:small subunit ribosomal protein S6e
LIVSDKETGKSSVYELKDPQALALVGLKIGDEMDASVLGIDGRIKITGGSDRAGFPMRMDVMGGGKRYALLTKGVGFRSKRKGERRRKLVRGNTITEDIYQVNALLIK